MSRQNNSRTLRKRDRVERGRGPRSWQRTRPAVEELEYRLTPSVGGGWISSTQAGQTGDGALGQYFSNSTLVGNPSFTRWDDRLDFSWPNSNAYPGGSPDPAFVSVGPTGWSSKWTGILTANFNEAYTFQINSAGNGVRLWVTPVGQLQGNPLISDWTSHGQTTDSATMTLQAGQDYAVELDLSETSATAQQVQLKWSSPSTPLEDIEPVTQVGLNVDGGDALFANLVNGGTRTTWWSPGNNWNVTVPTDGNLWPQGDAETLLGEGDANIQAGGSYLVQFSGMADVTEWPQSVDWWVNGTDLHSQTLQAGQGYNASTNTTTATIVIPPSGYSALYLSFTNTSRNPASALAVSAISESGTTVTVSVPSVAGFAQGQEVTIAGFTGSSASYNGTYVITGVNAANHTLAYSDPSTGLPTNPSGGTARAVPQNGITNLYVMQPSTLGGNSPLPVGTLFTPSALSMTAQYSVLRFMDLNNTNGNLTSNWSDRTLVGENFWSGVTFNSGTGVDTNVTQVSPLAGLPWETQIALANEAGKDVYINVPSNVSVSYLTNLANVFAYGSNGVTPYTSVQANPVWKPLNPNLKVYIEFSNELWNGVFSQAETNGVGWANQLSQRALYDYLTNNQNDPLYPGGGGNAFNDGATLAAYAGVSSSNDSAFLSTYNANPGPSYYGGSPAYFSNSAGINGYGIGQSWVGLRDAQISNAFKTAFGETNINASDTSSRVRPVFEWQYGGSWSGALGFISSTYGALHPTNYYLYGGGGGWYADNTVGGFTDVSFANPAFANGLAGWSSTGSVGVAANGSAMGNPNAPPLFSPIAITNGASESGTTVTITTAAPHNFVVGQSVSVAGVPVGGYDGTFTITSITATTFTFQDSTTGLANSGDGTVTGTGSSTQTAYLNPGASISQNVTFSGGYADITLYATQTVAFDWSHGLNITLTPTNGGPTINNGQPIAVSEGASLFSGNQNAFAWDRSQAFYTGSSRYSYKVTFTSTLPSGTIFFDNVAIQTVNGMFNETTTAASAGLSVSNEIQSDVSLALQYGLKDVGYEGGYDFNQNQSGYLDINGYADMGLRGYSSGVPNVGMYANLDPRTTQFAMNTLGQFFAAGGSLGIEYESSNNINSWGVAAPTYFNWNTPKVQATASVEQAAQPATYGLALTQPGTSTSWWMSPGASYDNPVSAVYLLPRGTYALNMTFGANGSAPAGQVDVVDIYVDGRLISAVNVPVNTGGTFNASIGALGVGQHSVELYNNAPLGNHDLFLGSPGTAIFTLSSTAATTTPTITWPTPGSIVYGTPLGSSQLDATANVPGTFVYSPSSGAILHAGSDTLSTTFTPTDTTHYTTATATTAINVTKATPSVNVTDGGTYSGAAIAATATVAGVVAGVDATPAASLEGVSPALTYYAGTTATGTPLPGAPTSVGTYTVVASFPGSADYLAATAQVTFTINQATPTLTWPNPASIVYGTSLGTTQLDATASVAGGFVYTPALGTLLHAGNGQTLSVTFTPTDTTDYTTATATAKINVTQATPTLTWPNPANIVYGTALGSTQLDATSSVAGTFAYTPASGAVLHAGNSQTLSVTFTPTDTTDYTTATATARINVTQATPALTWPNPANIVYGTALGSTQLDATASAAGTFAYTPVSGTVLNAGSGQTLSVTFTPTDTSDYTTATTTTKINVTQATPTLTWPNPANIVYGTALGSTQLDATASAVGTFVYTPAVGTVLHAGNTQTLSVTFTPTDTTDYTTATATAKINVTQATPTLTWPNPANIVYGTALGSTQLDATASVAGAFAYTPASGTVLGAGNGQTLSVTFSPTDTTDYTTATGTAKINVTKATPTLTWTNPANILYGTALGSTQLNATASVVGTFLYTPAAGTVLSAGNSQTLSVTFTPTDTTDYATAAGTAKINVTQATPTLTWPNPANLVYGTALGSTQLDATASVAGTFSYTPASGTVLSAGNGQTLSVTFTPTDTTDYTPATTTAKINVSQATPSLAWPNPANIMSGTALGSTQLDATANVAGTFAYTPAAGTVLSAGNAQILSVTFSPTDTTDYVATTATAIINVVLQSTPTLTWPNPANITYGTALGSTQLDATASVPGTFVYTPASGTILNGGIGQTLSVIFTPTDLVHYTTATAVAKINVNQAIPTLTWPNPANIAYGTALGSTQLDAIASVAGTFLYTPTSGTVLGAGNGQTLSVTFTPTDTTDYTSASATAKINVTQATPTLTWPNPANILYGTALGGTQLDATASVPGTFAYAPALGTILNAGNGQTLSVSFTPTDTVDYTTATTTAKINVTPATPTLTWPNPANIVYGTALGGVQLDATASVPGTFAYTPPSGTVLGAGNSQTLSVTFTPTDAADYTTATGTARINVTQSTPTITWPNPADIVYGIALGSTQLNATASVPGTFVYTPASGTVLHAGSGQTLSVTFTPTDTTDYAAAASTAKINVSRATPSDTWPNPANIMYGTPLGSAQLDASSSVLGTFVYTPSSGTVLSAGPGQTLSGTFMPSDTTDYNTAAATAKINVMQSTPTITWPNPANIVYGTALGGTQLDATAGVAGTFVYTPALGTVLNAGNGQTLSVTFTPTDATDYTTATASVKINVVLQSTPTITWPNPANIVYGTVLGSSQLDATASVPGTFAYTPAAGSVLSAGNSQTLNVTFSPTDTTDYTSATATARINVTQATPTINWPNPANIVYGTALGTTQLDATANVPGTFAYSPNSGSVLSAGNGQALSVTFTPTDSTDYTTASTTVRINVTQATPTITWPNPANIVSGTALGTTQLDATASAQGVFVYTPASGTVLGLGNGQTLSVTFTPTDTTDYTTAAATATVNVVAHSMPTITWLNPANIVYGTALGSTQLDATANVAGTFAYTPAPGTVLNAGNGQTLSVTFTPTDTIDYSTATATATINVTQATPVMTWPTPANVVYGTALTSTQLDAAANVGGRFTYSPAAGTVLSVGNGQTLSVTFTPTDTANYTTATAAARINVTQATPALTWSNPANIAYGTALGATQLNATANVKGSFLYTPAAGTALAVGNHQALSVKFMPTDTTDYGTASATVFINVIRREAPGDFTGVGKSDLAIYSSRTGVLEYQVPNGTTVSSLQYGPAGAGAISAPGDYFGDGKSDLAVYVPQSGIFAVKDPSGAVFTKAIGPANGTGFVPAPGDYDGSGRTEMAIYSSALGEFIYQPAAGGAAVTVNFGPAGQSFQPAPGDYDGDGKTDFAVFSPQSAIFAIRYSSGITSFTTTIGPPHGGFVPAPGDYDGDGKTDIAIYSSQYGLLGYLPSHGGASIFASIGASWAGAEVVPGDYDGDGKTDLAVYVPQTGVFDYKPSSGAAEVIKTFGPANAGFVGYLAPPSFQSQIRRSAAFGDGSPDSGAPSVVTALVGPTPLPPTGPLVDSAPIASNEAPTATDGLAKTSVSARRPVASRSRAKHELVVIRHEHLSHNTGKALRTVVVDRALEQISSNPSTRRQP
jgi:hypothetical protein